MNWPAHWVPASDRNWRGDAVPQIIGMCRRTWHPMYQENLIDIAEFTVARVEGALTPQTDCVVYFGRVPLGCITVTNPERVRKANKGYPVLREYLETRLTRDAVPIVCGRVSDTFSVWDGHHRLRTYHQAGRKDIPAIVAHFHAGTGRVWLDRGAAHR